VGPCFQYLTRFILWTVDKIYDFRFSIQFPPIGWYSIVRTKYPCADAIFIASSSSCIIELYDMVDDIWYHSSWPSRQRGWLRWYEMGWAVRMNSISISFSSSASASGCAVAHFLTRIKTPLSSYTLWEQNISLYVVYVRVYVNLIASHIVLRCKCINHSRKTNVIYLMSCSVAPVFLSYNFHISKCFCILRYSNVLEPFQDIILVICGP